MKQMNNFEEFREYIANQLKIQQLQIEALEGQIKAQRVAEEMANKSPYPTQEDFDKELMLRVVAAIVTSRKQFGTAEAMQDKCTRDNLICKYYNAAKKGISITLKDRNEKWYE